MKTSPTDEIADALALHRALLINGQPPFDEPTVRAELWRGGIEFLDVFFPPIGLSVGVEAKGSSGVLGLGKRDDAWSQHAWKRPADFLFAPGDATRDKCLVARLAPGRAEKS